ncbi:unnamed protein product [Kuraishia capsulata CBS 1993]|uniref:SUMO-conjugating enzyme UBC9 n=1 Tax=Kuraishia capsulata CBS 1993 TaxID=1382522 RepID=W6MFP5_9ASCO|nr:uncharacterized protein KUCA_T00000403001 [Kuraishia capsulata CBS 1993]CDK24441.1 unnamed protein product [Kuraishia capsulata CBS 1993]
MPEQSLCLQRLQQERKQWRKDHPFGFFAKPKKDADGYDLYKWVCGIPGKQGTIWEGATYPITVTFTQDYPAKAPKVKFTEDFYHPNVYPSGTVCLSILNDEQDWKPSISLKEILLGVQELLTTPNPLSPAQEPAYRAYMKNREEYDMKVKEQAKHFS